RFDSPGAAQVFGNLCFALGLVWRCRVLLQLLRGGRTASYCARWSRFAAKGAFKIAMVVSSEVVVGGSGNATAVELAEIWSGFLVECLGVGPVVFSWIRLDRDSGVVRGI